MVAWFEAGEGKLGMSSHEVVSLVLAEDQEFLGHHGANTVETAVSGSGSAAAIAKEPGYGVDGAGCEFLSEDVEI